MPKCTKRRTLKAGRTYGVARVCEGFGIPRSPFYAAERASRFTAAVAPRSQAGDLGRCGLGAIRTDFDRSPWIGDGHRKVWVRLRVLDGIRIARKRSMREAVSWSNEGWGRKFFDLYNAEWLVEKNGLRSPRQTCIAWDNAGMKQTA